VNPAVFAFDRLSLSIDEISMFLSEQYKSERRKGEQQARWRVVAMNACLATNACAQIKDLSSLFSSEVSSYSMK